ncbi:CHAD domain-containing protein [Pseudokordiimonas caeni]|uniref:CHAD domain-containing protein n=1 Tax=Pseudokordiimonas caeni TaxID=2997908 RepID=UPI00281256AD|nr:CHAD domain-containing protein [Pseudokordiimonas caeni]
MHSMQKVMRALKKVRRMTATPKGKRRKVVHRARQSCKRVRASLAVIPVESADLVRDMDDRIGKAARTLGPVRDAAVHSSTLKKLRQKAATPEEGKQLKRLQKAIRRADLAAGLSARKVLKRFSRQIDKALKVARGAKGHAASASQALPALQGLRDAYAAARLGLLKVRRSPDAAAFHRWRRAIEHLRDQLPLLPEGKEPALQSLHDDLAVLAKALGKDHDLAMLAANLERLSDAVPADLKQTLVMATERDRRRIEADALEAGGKLFALTPAAMLKAHGVQASA